MFLHSSGGMFPLYLVSAASYRPPVRLLGLPVPVTGYQGADASLAWPAYDGPGLNSIHDGPGLETGF